MLRGTRQLVSVKGVHAIDQVLYLMDFPTPRRVSGKVCANFGGTCLGAAAEVSNTCAVSYTTPCSTSHGDGICTCTR